MLQLGARFTLITLLLVLVAALGVPVSAGTLPAALPPTAGGAAAAAAVSTATITPTVPITPTKTPTRSEGVATVPVVQPAATQVVTPTKLLPTVTKPAPTATLTKVPATATATKLAPTATITPTKTITSTKVPPTATATATATKPAPRVSTSIRSSTSKSLSTNFTLVNMGSSDASVAVSYYKSDGSAWPADLANTGPFTVTMNFGQKIVTQYTDSTMTTGQGSAVVSSSQPLGAVVQIQARNQTPSMGAYINSSPANTFYVPQVFRNRTTGQGLTNTQIVVQSAQSSGTTAVTVQFIPSPGFGYSGYTNSGTISIQPSASYVYDIANESPANLPDGWIGSAIVTTANPSQNISVVVNTFGGPDSLGTYNAFPAGSPTPNWSIPLFTSRLPNGLSTPVIIQNLSGGDIAAGGITMHCTSSVSSPSTLDLSNSSTLVPNNAPFVFNPVTDTSIAANWTGSCRLSAGSSNVVVVVQMRQPFVNANFDTYPAFPSNSTNTTVVVPLMSKRQPNGFATVATIQNLDTVNAANVTLTYTPGATCGGCSSMQVNKTIAAGGNLLQNMRLPSSGGDSVNLPDGWYGTLVVQAQSGTTARPIVGFVQLTNINAPPGDTLMTHDAFSLP